VTLVVISGLFAIGATLLGVALTHGNDPVARGTIGRPQQDQTVVRTETVSGTIENVPDGQHAWLAVERPGGLFFVDKEIAARDRRWLRQLPSGLPPGKRFSVSLLLVGEAGARAIRRWGRALATRGEMAAASGGATPPPSFDAVLMPVADLSDRAILDLKSDLVLPVPPPPRPVESVLPQAKGSDGVAFDFAGGGGELATAFTPDSKCHRGHLPLGLRLEWKMSGAGIGGWGVEWSSKSPSGRFDASRFERLVFHLKGARGGEKFQVGLKDTSGAEFKVESKDRLVTSSSEWTEFVVPLSAFKGVDRKRVENVNLGFNKTHGTGMLCVDEIAFAT
jgi:hypothetical protein